MFSERARRDSVSWYKISHKTLTVPAYIYASVFLPLFYRTKPQYCQVKNSFRLIRIRLRFSRPVPSFRKITLEPIPGKDARPKNAGRSSPRDLARSSVISRSDGKKKVTAAHAVFPRGPHCNSKTLRPPHVSRI